MQEELIEMLDKMVKYFDEISSDSYYYRETASILNEAEKLVEKAKNSVKEPAVPDVDSLAQFIRQIDGSHTMGTAALAERICEWLNDRKATEHAAPAVPQGEPVTLTDSYAGVIAWIGDKQCKRVLTEGAIKHEHTPGVAMRNAAHQCVQEVITALREKEGSDA